MTNDLSSIIDQVRRVFPLAIKSVQVHEGGDDFLVLEVNQEWMFRFPRNASAQEALQREKLFLPQFEKISTIAVPKIQYMSDNFIGYKKISGPLLTPQLFQTLGRKTQKELAKQVGEFLSILHKFPLGQAFHMGLTEGWNGWRQKAYIRFKQNVVPCLSSMTAQKSIEFLDRYFALDWKPVVIHGDFYLQDHGFLDMNTQQLCGIIDFGDLTIEDAASDLKCLVEYFGNEFLQHVLANYSAEIDQHLIHRIDFRIKSRPLFDASYAIEYGFDERFRRRLSEIEAMFSCECA